mmetsp:Transcript_6082/g.9158  ORF Transcript_6082/g.9158 Transcript_6082/m.9158 type:complete len:102 (+) Transcript_6082:2570-2875(+)
MLALASFLTEVLGGLSISDEDRRGKSMTLSLSLSVPFTFFSSAVQVLAVTEMFLIDGVGGDGGDNLGDEDDGDGDGGDVDGGNDDVVSLVCVIVLKSESSI